MNQTALNLRDLVANAAAKHAPLSPQLWSRIAATYAIRKRRRRLRFIGTGLLGVGALVLLAVFVPSRLHTPAAMASIDWQARAQALELQLDALPLPVDDESTQAQQTVSAIARVDRDLQAAYDDGAARHALLALWKQRSDLLSVLLVERHKQPIVSGI